MENQGVDDLVRKSILLVEQHTDEEGVGTGVVHLSEMGDGGSGVNHGNGGFGKDGGEDGGFLESAGGLEEVTKKEGGGGKGQLSNRSRVEVSRSLRTRATSREAERRGYSHHKEGTRYP